MRSLRSLFSDRLKSCSAGATQGPFSASFLLYLNIISHWKCPKTSRMMNRSYLRRTGWWNVSNIFMLRWNETQPQLPPTPLSSRSTLEEFTVVAAAAKCSRKVFAGHGGRRVLAELWQRRRQQQQTRKWGELEFVDASENLAKKQVTLCQRGVIQPLSLPSGTDARSFLINITLHNYSMHADIAQPLHSTQGRFSLMLHASPSVKVFFLHYCIIVLDVAYVL